jgi:DNA polymerase-1
MSMRQLLDVEHSLEYHTAKMTQRGLLCDTDETQRQIEILDSGIEQASDRLADIGIPANVAKDEGRLELTDYLIDAGCELVMTPKSKKLKIGADDLRLMTMEANEETQAVVEDLIFIKKAQKIQSAYLYPFLMHAEADGRVHPSIKTMGARTHRMSVSQPPLQQIPRDPMKVKDKNFVEAATKGVLTVDTRGCLVADPGRLLVTADYAQIEQRVYATLAGEPELIEAFRNGDDFHKTVASRLFDVDTEDVSTDQRQIAKNAGYLMIYGGGPRKLAVTAGITIDHATEIQKSMKKAQPNGMRYAKGLASQEAITTPFGRVLPIDPARRYAAINYMIQSTARDLFVIGMVRLITAGYADYLWIPEHDEILMNVPEENAESIAEEMGRLMHINFYGVPIVAEGTVLGKRWRKA